MILNRRVSHLLVASAVFALACESPPKDIRPQLSGIFLSEDEPGVLIFGSDGSFGYKIPAKFLTYDEAHLPPDHGRFRVGTGGSIELLGFPPDYVDFTLKVDESFQTVTLARPKPDGLFCCQLPEKATYRKRSDAKR